MHKTHLLFVAFLVLLVLSITSVLRFQSLNDHSNSYNPTTTYQSELSNYTDNLILALDKQNEQLHERVFSSNFEGPKIAVEYLAHHNKIWDKEQLPEFSFTPQFINFDPDWESYGLPNLHIEVTQPIFISALNQDTTSSKLFEELKNQFGILMEPSPIKSYSKSYKNSEGKLVKEYFELYLTQFQLNIGIKPMREPSMISLTSEEKRKKSFPKYWYQDLAFAANKFVSLNELKHKKEAKNQRYSNLSCVFKIVPNNKVAYSDSKTLEQISADVAIGEIITKQITSNFKNESDYRQAHIIPSAPGLNLDLFSESSLENRFTSLDLNKNIDIQDASIFNKPVYFRIQSNNLGSWDKKGIFFGTEWDDQFTYTFLMPILVKGKFDVLLDNNLKPAYIPQKAYYNKVTIKDIIPDWGLNNYGKYFSYAFIVFILLVAIIFLPQVFTLINVILKRVAHKIKTPPTK